jgi:hypothetical protein
MFIALLYKGFQTLMKVLESFFLLLLLVAFVLYGIFIFQEWNQYWLLFLLSGN